ncbi:hypothetical protein DKW60_12590 [Leucothrix pacifica]|uniref:Uncharacterized protein n=1 Tax=Leucothrix pacifica TaxID=1247513 RepID=A0A317CD64_9GAMM|nr:hypothetical protein DKW60_12590 [Leucothrix pacifica]
MDDLIDQLKRILETRESAMQCGGTYAADRLRTCLSLLDQLNAYQNHPKYEKVLDALLSAKDIWQSALVRHNSNSLKFIEYDVSTGLQKYST